MNLTNKLNFKKYANKRLKILFGQKSSRQLLWYGASFDLEAEKKLKLHKKIFRNYLSILN